MAAITSDDKLIEAENLWSAYFVAPKISSEFLINIFLLNNFDNIIAGKWLWNEKTINLYVFELVLMSDDICGYLN